ncbi:tail fiber domain-containing protein [Alphaproteobacteria bacterium]|nr:tail fiber domain-containing protein [Alphaproteobacteria bacterium]
MPYSSGTFSRVHDFTDDRDNGIRIQASRMDAEMDGIATGLSTALLKDGTQTATAKIPFAVGLSVIDNQTILLGTNSDIAIQYDETTNDSLEISANVEGAALGIVLKSDQGDDNADQHKLSIADGGTLTLGSKISGSFVSYLTHTPNATVASSTLAVAGNLTVGGNLTLGSGAELSEAELEMLDGITAGTVAASKAVVVDANKDIASFRNVTLTGELDAATGDFSGDVDVDGTLEADAITVNGTALATVIAGTTVTTATNANHVSVADNESTNEENLIPFIEDASATGNVGLESDGDFAYNPSTGTVSATVFKGNIDAVDGDFDGTLEADAMTLNGTAITATATLDTGISNNNVPKFTSGVVDDDFLRVNGTAIEGRSASEVLSDIGASAVAGSSSIVTTGALDSGSITSGFGTINTGSSNITSTGVGAFGSLDISGDIDVDGTTNLDVVDIDGAVDMASTLQVDGAITSSSGMTITRSDNNAQLTLISTDADDSGGPILDLFRNSSSPADGDVLGLIRFKGEDAGGNETTYAQIIGFIQDEAGGAEDGTFKIETLIGGSSQARLNMGSTSTVFNEGSLDLDFRVESDNDANAFFVEGDTGNVAIGTNDPTVQDAGMRMLHIHNSATDGTGRSSLKLTNGDSTLAASRGAIITLDDAAQLTIGAFESAGKIIFTTGGTTTRLSIFNDGRIGHGATSAISGAHFTQTYNSVNGAGFNLNSVDASGQMHSQIIFRRNGGNVGSIDTNGSSTQFSTSSDYRLKENVTTSWDATTRLKQLKPSRFNFKIDADTTVDGFLAHEVSSIVPEAITGTKDGTEDITNVILNADGTVNSDGVSQSDWTAGKSDETYASDTTWVASKTIPKYQSIDQSKLVPLLTKTILELEARITALESA